MMAKGSPQVREAVRSLRLDGVLTAWLAVSAAAVTLATALGDSPEAAAGYLVAAGVAALAARAIAPTLEDGRHWAQGAAAAIWTAFAMAAAGATGGGLSPFAASFLIGPAFVLRFAGARVAGEAALFSALGYGVMVVASRAAGAEIGGAGPLAQFAGLTNLALAAALCASALASAAPNPAPLPRNGALARVDFSGRLIDITPRAAALLGVSGEGLHPIARRIADRPGDANALSVAMRKAQLVGEAQASLRRDGTALDVSIVREGEGLLLSVSDVTAWAQRIEAAETAANVRADALARRAAELSHELRTPLNHILGFADVMALGLHGPLAPKHQEYLGLIQLSARNLLELVTGLMDLSRIESGKHELEVQRFDAREVLAEAAAVFGEAARAKGVLVVAEAAERPLPVDADPRALRQILANLIANAVKFTPERGEVRVRAFAEGGALALEVDDDGPGIPAAERARLGQAFERGAGALGVEGVGLGLSIVRAFAALHGGRLILGESARGGTLARVEAPVLAHG